MIPYLDEIGITVTDFRDAYKSMYKPLYLYKMTVSIPQAESAFLLFKKKADYTGIFKLNTLLAESWL